MRKLRLTEEELTRIVKRTLIEMEDGSQDFNEVIKCINDYFKFKARDLSKEKILERINSLKFELRLLENEYGIAKPHSRRPFK
jgi:hypothetical protein